MSSMAKIVSAALSIEILISLLNDPFGWRFVTSIDDQPKYWFHLSKLQCPCLHLFIMTNLYQRKSFNNESPN